MNFILLRKEKSMEPCGHSADAVHIELLVKFDSLLIGVDGLHNSHDIVLGLWQGQVKILVPLIDLNTPTIFTRNVEGQQGRMDSEHGTGKRDARGERKSKKVVKRN